MCRLANQFYRFFMLAAVTLLLPVVPSALAATTPEQVQDFVHQVYIEGVPYTEASQLSADVALPVLEEILNNPREEDYWANVVVTIGMIGSDQGAKVLTDFITRKEAQGKLTRAQTVAKTSAVMSLGYIVNKTGNRTALDFLMKSTDPQTWNKRKLAWTGEFHTNETERDKQLASIAVLGLGVSGNSVAAKFLESLKAQPTTPHLRALKMAIPEIEHIAEEALKTNRAISTGGIHNYYKKIQPKHAPNEGRLDVKPRAEHEMVKPPFAGELIKKAEPGEVLRQPQLGEVVSPARTGEILKPTEKGEQINVQ
ncbi:MAG TPA: hypothetical protein PKK23_05735 [Nitrospirales bacterium]|nr:hypothetical protein [Nitrospiraceae bacterium]HNP28524.1 hypothetical protein [Nitrospirales bacterium]